jgi:protein-S-isoprenylcysteine O-methyltransferase Ste14
MIASVVILPTAPMLAVAAFHVSLMVIKARNEEAFLHGVHGVVYARYCAETGRFLPRFGGRGVSARRD